jgi:hypothetical protein
MVEDFLGIFLSVLYLDRLLDLAHVLRRPVEITTQTGHGLDVPGTATRGVSLTSTYGVAATNDLITLHYDIGDKALAELSGL